jgi:hypothetical protein
LPVVGQHRSRWNRDDLDEHHIMVFVPVSRNRCEISLAHKREKRLSSIR